jgi:multiple sugar transport system permease protein
MNTRLSPLKKRRERWFYLLIMPWFIGFILFQICPLFGAVTLAFADWRLPKTPEFVGIRNFDTLVQDPLFKRTLLNTLYYTLGTVPSGLLLGLGLALLLNTRVRGINLFRTLFFLPVAISGVATTLLWGWIFNPRFGLINSILAIFGIHGPAWLQDQNWAMPSLIIISLWTVGVNLIIYLAALQTIPKELQEAAALDGAGAIKQFIHITWPLITPVTFYLIVVNVIGSFQVFTPTYILTRGGPDYATLTLPLYIYLNAFAWGRLGYASALAILLFIIVLLLTLFQFRLGRQWVFSGGEESG